MYKTPKFKKTSLDINTSVEGETLEMKLTRVIANGESLKDVQIPVIFQERKDGVNVAYNIRTDSREIALEAMDKLSKDYIARREGKESQLEIEKQDGQKQNEQKQNEQKQDGGKEDIG